MSRQTFLQILYSHIQDKSKVHARKGLSTYEETEDGIVVTTEDGEEFDGSILVGVDGINSRVRRVMADRIENTEPAAAKNLREGFTAQYHCLFATSNNEYKDRPGQAIMREATVGDFYCKGYSGLVAAGTPGQLFWFFYLKSATRTQTPNIPRYSEADAEEAMRKHGHNHVGAKFTFKDLWDARTSFNVAALEEGILKTKWSRGRVVLLGDAVHKVRYCVSPAESSAKYDITNSRLSLLSTRVSAVSSPLRVFAIL